MDRNRPALVSGTRYEFSVPFKGDAVLFNARASTFNYNPPHAQIKDGYLLFTDDRTDHNAEALKAAYQQDLDAVNRHLEWVRADVEPLTLL